VLLPVPLVLLLLLLELVRAARNNGWSRLPASKPGMCSGSKGSVGLRT
jgi:hypothetical protein